MIEKVKLFTHLDLDGYSCSILAQYVFGSENVDVTYCDYKNIDSIVQTFLEEEKASSYDLVLITDISVTNKTASHIEKALKNKKIKDLQLLDHHETAIWLNDYSWGLVVVKSAKGKESGVSLLDDYLSVTHKDYGSNIEPPRWFIEKVRRYDTWEWKEIYDDIEAKRLNDLLKIHGAKEFVNRTLQSLNKHGDFFFDDQEIELLTYHQKQIDKYIERKLSQVKTIEYNGYKIGVLFAEQFVSELGNAICEERKDLDMVAMILLDHGVISYRTVKDDVHVGEFAKQHGGGGHAKAAGNPLPDLYFEKMLEGLFEKKER